MAVLVGASTLCFGIVARSYASSRGFLPVNPRVARLRSYATLERMLLLAGGIAAVGLLGLGYAIWSWVSVGFGPLEGDGLVRILLASCTLIALGLQLAFTACLWALIDIEA